MTRTPVLRGFAVSALVASAALLSACGSSATKALSAPSVSASASPATSPSARETSPGAEATATATPSSADASVEASASTVATPAIGDPNSKFCDIAKSEQAQSAQLAKELESGDQASLKAFIMKAYAQLPAFAAAAPPEIKVSVQKLVDIDNKLFTALKQNDYDFAKSASAVSAAVMDPGFASAGAMVTSYLTNTCGVKASIPTSLATP